MAPMANSVNTTASPPPPPASARAQSAGDDLASMLTRLRRDGVKVDGASSPPLPSPAASATRRSSVVSGIDERDASHATAAAMANEEIDQALHRADRAAALNDCRAPVTDAIRRLAPDIPATQQFLLARSLPGVVSHELNGIPNFSPRSSPQPQLPTTRPRGTKAVVLAVGRVPYSCDVPQVIAVLLLLLKESCGGTLPSEIDPSRVVLAGRAQMRRGPNAGGLKKGLFFIELGAEIEPYLPRLLDMDRRVLFSARHLMIFPSYALAEAWVDSRDEFLNAHLEQDPSAKKDAHANFTKGLGTMTIQRSTDDHPGRTSPPPALQQQAQQTIVAVSPGMTYAIPASGQWLNPTYGNVSPSNFVGVSPSSSGLFMYHPGNVSPVPDDAAARRARIVTRALHDPDMHQEPGLLAELWRALADVLPDNGFALIGHQQCDRAACLAQMNALLAAQTEMQQQQQQQSQLNEPRMTVFGTMRRPGSPRHAPPSVCGSVWSKGV